MPSKTANYGLTKPLTTENYNIEDQNGNMDLIDKGLVMYGGNTTGAANTYAISSPVITDLKEGMAVSVKFHAASTGASTLNWCGLGAKAIKKVDGSNVINLKINGIYTLRYDGTNFILQGEGASGDATASDLLLGKKATTDAGEITGTMPNIGPEVADTIELNSHNQEYTIPLGKHSGLRKIKAVITNLAASVIKAGTTVGGVVGTFTDDATATDADVLAGKAYYRQGVKGNGAMVRRTGSVYPGYEPALFRAAANGRLHMYIPKGAYIDSRTDGAGGVDNQYPGVYFDDANFIPSNIKKDVAMFGMIGTLPAGLQGASGTVWSTANGTQLPFYNRGANATQMYPYFTVSGLNFKPKMIVARKVADYNNFYHNVYYNVNTAIPGQGTISSNGSTWSDKDSGEGASWGAYVTATGFQLPVQVHSSEYQWWAFTW